ncbi:MAG: bifunctional diaminohydroxyphosphoribosylaminopyrimidine deaminase/5-amino-6-(5-phosphoribosylamino)uracil reductase RibD [Deltaproteobacteria bacterium]|nr:MAG: bifunctional diaminohydroxyphosphoribosylaminopyrimidine deaminase/5-amino-6-(5-phosphoribosylamino)uracil reductase RibD [Deltaproteobacteria bacterium]
MSDLKKDMSFMGMALDLARLALGRTSPNPMVGAVIVKDGKVIGKGFHRQAGMAHAEVEALNNCRGGSPWPPSKKCDGVGNHGGLPLRDATLYVTLEPCCHQGRTPPCVDAILKSGIREVVIGMKDPDQKVAGKGIRILKKNGIKVRVGILEKECRALNAAYIKHRQTGLPYVTLKIASTLDGKVALSNGESKWITNEESRDMGHVLPDQHDAIVVGIGTVQTDDPQLTTRLRSDESHDPIRVVLDSSLKISAKAKVLRQISASPTWIATTLAETDKKIKNFEKKFSRVSFEILSCRSDSKHRVDLKDLLKKIAARGVVSVLVEGGPSVATSFLQQKLVDRVVHFISPSYVGGNHHGALGDLLIKKLGQKMSLREIEVRTLGSDIMIEGFINL